MDATRETDRRTEPRPGSTVPPPMDVRDEDLEPHAGLRYIARLFKVLAVLLILLLIAEIVLGLMRQGSEAIPTLLIEATRLIVFGGLLWGAADMALMLIESNHDLRATRILVGRVNAKVQRMEEANPPIRTGGGSMPGSGGMARGGPSAPPPPDRTPTADRPAAADRPDAPPAT